MTEASFLRGVKKAAELKDIKSAIIFGDSGLGKSTLAMSAQAVPSMGPVLVVDIEGSATAGARLYPDCDFIPAPTFEHLEVIKHDLLESEHPYKTVIFDTLNVAQGIALKHFEQEPENQRNTYGKWADLLEWTTDFVRDMHNAPFTAIFIAHAEDVKGEFGLQKTTISIQGKAQEKVPTIPDILGYLAFEEVDGKVERVIYTGQNPRLVTKNRFGLPNRIVDPTMQKIQNEITKAREEAKKQNTKKESK